MAGVNAGVRDVQRLVAIALGEEALEESSMEPPPRLPAEPAPE